MSTICNTFHAHSFTQGLALFVLCALLVGGQAAETAHADADCEHESCSLCVGFAADDALGSDPELPSIYADRRVASLDSATLNSWFQTLAHFIRGPPTP